LWEKRGNEGKNKSSNWRIATISEGGNEASQGSGFSVLGEKKEGMPAAKGILVFKARGKGRGGEKVATFYEGKGRVSEPAGHIRG